MVIKNITYFIYYSSNYYSWKSTKRIYILIVNKYVLLKENAPSNIKLRIPKLSLPYGVHHGKLIILYYKGIL